MSSKDPPIAGVQLGCLTNYASEEKSGIPKSRYVMPNERVLGSFHGSCRKRESASIVCGFKRAVASHAGHDVTCNFHSTSNYGNGKNRATNRSKRNQMVNTRVELATLALLAPRSNQLS
jgi:hypothetical protein